MNQMPIENPRSVFRQLPRKYLTKFKTNERSASESIADFVARNRITPEEIAWVQRQPLYGQPSLRRLRAELLAEGFQDIRFQLSDDLVDITFDVRLTTQVKAQDSKSLLRLWIRIFRAAGFCVGFSELGITNVEGPIISGITLTASLDPPAQPGTAIELEPE
jgi:hypothetical protein